MENLDLHNFAADVGYAQHLINLKKISDCNQHLHSMLKKYKHNDAFKQKILLHMAMLYFKENDFKKALSIFLEAIQLDKDSQVLQKFENILDDQRCYNIFEFVKLYFIPALKKLSNESDDLKNSIEKLEEYCKLNNSVPNQSSQGNNQTSGWLPSGQPRRTFPRQDQTFESHTSDAGWTPSDNAGQLFPPQDQAFPVTSDDVTWVPSGHARRGFPLQNQTSISSNNEIEWSPSGHPHEHFPLQDQIYESHSNDSGLNPSNHSSRSFQQDQTFPLPSNYAGWVPSGHARRAFPRQDQTFSAPSNKEERSRETARNILMKNNES